MYSIDEFDEKIKQRRKEMFNKFIGAALKTYLANICFQIICAFIVALPFHFAWNCIAPVYLTFLPKAFYHIPYLHMVSIILVTAWVGMLLTQLMPEIIKKK